MSSTEGNSECKHGDSSGVTLPVSEPQEETGKSIDRDVAVADESLREKKHKKKDRDRDRDRSRSRERDRDRKGSDRDKERKKSKSPDHYDHKRRSRSRSKDRRRRRSRSRSDSRDRDRKRDRRRSRSRSRDRKDRHRDRDRDRDRSRSRDRKRDSKDKEREKKSSPVRADETEYKPITIKEIIAKNPGISIADAVKMLNSHNLAAAGLAPAVGVGSTSIGMGVQIPMPLLSYPQPMLGAAGVTNYAAAGVLAAQALNQQGLGGLTALVGIGPKPARELYVGNLPPGCTVAQLLHFLNAALKNLGICGEQGCVVGAWINENGHFAFVEFRTIEESNQALIYIPGLQMMPGQPLKAGRPKTMGPGGPPLTAEALQMQMTFPLPTPVLGITAPVLGLGIADSTLSDVLLMTNLPNVVTDEQIKELISPFGDVKALNVIIDAKGSTKSAAFEFSDKTVVDSAISALNGFNLGASKLSLTRVPSNVATTLLIPAPKAPVNQPSSTTSASARAAAAIAALPPDPLKDMRPTRVLRMSNMVTDDDLEDDEAYEELKEDIAEELGLHGSVRSLVIPRPFEKGGYVPGVKQIFVQFATIEEAEKTRKAVAGRTFGGNPVIVYFYPEKLFNKFMYVLPNDFDTNSEEAFDNDVIEDDSAEAVPETFFEPVVQEDMD